MADNFSIEKPRDTGDDRVTFIVKFNGSVRPGFIAKDVLVGIGGLTSNNLVQMFTQHHAKIAAAVRRKLPAPMLPYIALTADDVK
jgi:hypothetical protein